jgi:hypothetical protein
MQTSAARQPCRALPCKSRNQGRSSRKCEDWDKIQHISHGAIVESAGANNMLPSSQGAGSHCVDIFSLSDFAFSLELNIAGKKADLGKCIARSLNILSLQITR